MHGLFLVLGMITVGCVLLITGYLVISGIPAIRQIGLWKFLSGKEWASTAAQPAYGILPFLLSSLYGALGAMAIGVPVGLLAAVYLAKLAGKRCQGADEVRRESIGRHPLGGVWFGGHDGAGSGYPGAV